MLVVRHVQESEDYIGDEAWEEGSLPLPDARLITRGVWLAYIHKHELLCKRWNHAVHVQHISAPLQQEPVNHTQFLSVIST